MILSGPKLWHFLTDFYTTLYFSGFHSFLFHYELFFTHLPFFVWVDVPFFLLLLV